ncbi:MAG: aminoglycoside 2-N-acetyltransferase [Klenkia sp.]|nr:aminoglycoside 2-N-acetyltransferase [Klenkia sp.]
MSTAPPPHLALRTAPTADLGDDGLDELHTFLDAAFAGDFDDEDWSHALGGVHVLARRDGELVGHASVVARHLVTAGTTLRTGYVEAVAVAATARRQGVAGAVMTELERLVRGGFELGALAASQDGAHLYESRHWTRWTGPLNVLTPEGVRAGDDSWVYVLSTPATPVGLDATAPLACDWRRGSAW